MKKERNFSKVIRVYSLYRLKGFVCKVILKDWKYDMNNITKGGSHIDNSIVKDTITWVFPTLMVLSRFSLAIISQAIIAGIFFLYGNLTPWKAAAPWWMVYGTIIDISCLTLLFFLTRKEGFKIINLTGYDTRYKSKDILTGLGYFLLFFTITMGCTLLAGILLYGSPQPPFLAGKLPIMGALYTVIIWPLVWGITEQLTYQGYSLPRMVKVTGNKWSAIFIVSFGWGLQHLALPLIPDWRFMLMRFL
jgi:uncharacterized protein